MPTNNEDKILIILTGGTICSFENENGERSTDAYEAKYKIGEDEEGNRTITFTYADDSEEFDLLPDGEALSFKETSEDDAEYIKIGIYTFKKAK